MEKVKTDYNGWKEAFYVLGFFLILTIFIILYLLIDHKL